ncbi:hypothetical protein L1987_54122 [Smallanthus sonchifolius]|uniref:Uncharacterized protein n=1 Tax=Smallanthus sonchifolius TaxID=185202 RepID=A0ACB9E6Q3_9ASTR|nr:hypothetical protein L1987_54122 [Smallanthus sonchifolius]
MGRSTPSCFKIISCGGSNEAVDRDEIDASSEGFESEWGERDGVAWGNDVARDGGNGVGDGCTCAWERSLKVFGRSPMFWTHPGTPKKATIKGFAIGSAALASFLLFSVYMDEIASFAHTIFT